MLATIRPITTRQQYYNDLMSCAGHDANCIWLAQIIASWLVGDGVLPYNLGLNDRQFQHLLSERFPGYILESEAPSGKVLDFSRMLEKQDLEQLLRQFAVKQDMETECLIAIIVAACLGSDHLWQDLGLWNRSALSDMLTYNFPELAARNDKDMKWKKFLYKHMHNLKNMSA